MKIITEISPEEEVRWEMTDEIFDLVTHFRLAKTMKQAVETLPADLQSQVRKFTICRPLDTNKIRGYRANLFLVDEGPYQRELEFKQEYQCEFWKPAELSKGKLDDGPLVPKVTNFSAETVIEKQETK